MDVAERYFCFEWLRAISGSWEYILSLNMHSPERLCQRRNVGCMKLLDLFEEIEEEMAKKGRSYLEHITPRKHCWLMPILLRLSGCTKGTYIPTMKECMATCGYTTLKITSFLGMGDIVTKESFDWASNDPDILRAASIICRLWDDIVGHKVQTNFLSKTQGKSCP
ncbi:unnamed protein product [Coffea canephora]|uniref:Terpene synthase metal-binding domain-containing protein n=1 Tax=Coffea canephora TaxID=49390 RepID=A0A068UV92_COFCA|nr:unnamed protein product [Coffea canephora]